MATRISRKGPGKAHRVGLSYVELTKLFPNDQVAERWFAEIRWPDGPHCPYCDSDKVQYPITHKSMTHRCQSQGCRKRFSVKTGTVMESSKIGCQEWAIAVYLYVTSLKSVSSMKLHRDLGRTQKTAWHLAHRLREAWSLQGTAFVGPVEVDESYFGGRRKNMSNAKRKALANTGRGPVGKTAVVGIRDRRSNKIRATSIQSTDAPTLQGFVRGNVTPDATIYTDDFTSYHGLPHHETVNHSAKQYVDGMAHINGMESFWATLKRAYHGTFHKLSPQHLERYIREFSGRHNLRDEDTLTQMVAVAQGMVGKRLRYHELVTS